MNASPLIPFPDSIPAPSWIFLVLDNALFLVHILLINLVVGGSLISLFCPPLPGRHSTSLAEVIAHKIPLFLPFGINLGVAPLLFLQVVYGHLFYTSSVLMAAYWISVIPVLILAYYGTYLYARRIGQSFQQARLALGLATVFFLYIAFVYVNNMTLMAQPERWTAYFQNRSGSLMNLADSTVIPRYLHFLAASVAVSALALAVLWERRWGAGMTGAESKVKTALRLFAIATAVQIGIGLWFLGALPHSIIKKFMGQDLVASGILALGVLAAIGALVTGLKGKLRPTLSQLAITLVAMVITRHNLRTLYLQPYFSPDQLTLAPQYSILLLFLAVLVSGLVGIVYMVRLAFAEPGKGGVQ